MSTAWLCLVLGILVYLDSSHLWGAFAYDDRGTVVGNAAVVSPSPPSVWSVDFWGTPLSDASSHKSFRPITTLTFRLNYLYASSLSASPSASVSTLSFHVVNVLLHGISCFLLVKVFQLILTDTHDINTSQQQGCKQDEHQHAQERKNEVSVMVGGLLFAVHPIHTEAVCNITGRAELLMSIFFLLAILTYVESCKRMSRRLLHSVKGSFGTCLVPLLLTALSMLAKETGITATMSCLAVEVCTQNISFQNMFHSIFTRTHSAQRDSAHYKSQLENTRWFLFRGLVLAVGTLLTATWRLWLNGNSTPNISHIQNPAAFAPEMLTRVLSMNWVYVHYLVSLVVPYHLSCDWSENSIPLITGLDDSRMIGVFALWIALAGATYKALVCDWNRPTLTSKVVLGAVFGLTISPFLLSSNLLVVAGTMKAERLIYLPSAGFCLLVGVCTGHVFFGGRTEWQMNWRLCSLLFVFGILHFVKLRERCFAWSHSLRLWEAAYQVNPQTYHTRYNYALELLMAGRLSDSKAILKSYLKERPTDFPARYVYATAFRMLGRCDKAVKIVDKGYKILAKKREEKTRRLKEGPVSDLERVELERMDVAHDESLLLTLKSYCAETVNDMVRYSKMAVDLAPHNAQAVGRAKEILQLIQKSPP